LAWHTGGDKAPVTEIQRYTSRFQNRLREAIQEDSVVELHLFAVIFAVLGARRETYPNSQRAFAVHLEGMVGMLYHLNSPRFQHQFRLRFLHHFAVSFVRGHGRKPVYENAYEIHLAARTIPLPLNLPDHRVGAGIPVQFWDTARDRIPWRAVMWAVMDELDGLYGCFQKLLVWERDTECRSDTDVRNIVSLLRSIRSNAEGITIHPTISNELEKVLRSSSILDTDR
jgi:hypothetical protein